MWAKLSKEMQYIGASFGSIFNSGSCVEYKYKLLSYQEGLKQNAEALRNDWESVDKDLGDILRVKKYER